MTMAILIPELLLAVWFFGCICTYRLGRLILVEGEGIKSPEFVKASYLPNPKHDEFILKTSILEGIVQTIDWKKFMMF